MQIGGLGGSHSTGDHHVTNCIHDHHDTQDHTGGMAMKSSAAADVQGAKAELQQEGLFSLTSWLKNALGNGKGFLLNFWGEGQASAGNSASGRAVVSGVESGQAVSQAAGHTETGVMASAAAAVPSAVQSNLTNNMSYQTAKEKRRQKQNLFQKMKDRFHNMSGQLHDKRAGKSLDAQTRDLFRTKREQSKEDLRRHSRHRRDTVEISCARTDDNYLMDSYDRRGEYSRLTTKK
ncbi:MAG: hypothetical protein NC331_11110 [Lachnospiraceae bacterium]|nr:hypothetical protein [Lachnospiraceae bacterium]MCM1239918.1 hypothetical protein [Lachnospiraceae bacterium]MCM1344675.1 hypothetical protein [Muribaculaceae bacterium]MCM1412451.1 hypothetical protein [Lachnospiraceae bacterium]